MSMVVFVDMMDCKKIGDIDVDEIVGFQMNDLLVRFCSVILPFYRKYETPLGKLRLIAALHVYYSALNDYISRPFLGMMSVSVQAGRLNLNKESSVTINSVSNSRYCQSSMRNEPGTMMACLSMLTSRNENCKGLGI